MLWDTIKSSISSTLPASEFDLWIKPITCIEQEADSLHLVGPDRFFCAWVEERYLEVIRAQSIALGSGKQIVIKPADAHPGPRKAAQRGQMRLPGVARGGFNIRSLHPAFTFDQFMVGESNILARSACQALAKADYTFGRCLFMNSSTGLGKSHLTQAVVHEVLRAAPSTRLHYLTAQQFSAEMIKGIRAKTMDEFSRKYVNDCDMLLVEDVHTLTGRAKTQEELNIILDYLLKTGRRVILTSALAPDQIKGLDTDFRSRMSAGLVTGIQSPEFSTRMRIIRHKMAAHGMPVADDLIEYMAERLQGDIRRMESAIMGIKAKSCLLQAPPNMCMLQDILGGLGPVSRQPSADSIRDFISVQFRLSVEDLCSRSRKKNIVFPRQVAMYLTRKYTSHSFAEIGAVYNRDHSTVLYAVKTITQDMVRQTATREQVERLCGQIEKLEL